MPLSSKQTEGRRRYDFGLAAEAAVARHYKEKGYTIEASRWRHRGGEIDLIASKGELLAFVEVKAAKTLDAAKLQLQALQISRLMVSALEYLAQNELSFDTEMRFDLACMDVDGKIEVTPNVIEAELFH